MPVDEQQGPRAPQEHSLGRRMSIVAIALAFAGVMAPSGTAAPASDLAACAPDGKATVNPAKDAPTSIDLNRHRSVGIEYAITQCNPNDKNIQVRAEGLDNPSAVSGTFESAGDGVGFLHLTFNRSAIGAGSNDVRVVINGAVHTSVLTLTLKQRSPMWIAGIIALGGCLGGLILFGLRTLESNAGWWRVWRWKPFQPVAGILILIASVGAALGVLFKGGLATDWTAGTDWWSLFLKIGTVSVGAATAIAATGAAHSAAGAIPEPAPSGDPSAAVDSTGQPGVAGATDST